MQSSASSLLLTSVHLHVMQGTFSAEKPADLRAGRLVIDLFDKEVRHDLQFLFLLWN